VPWLRWLDTSPSPWRSRFDPRLSLVGFMLDTVKFNRFFSTYFSFPWSESFQQCSIFICSFINPYPANVENMVSS